MRGNERDLLKENNFKLNEKYAELFQINILGLLIPYIFKFQNAKRIPFNQH